MKVFGIREDQFQRFCKAHGALPRGVELQEAQAAAVDHADVMVKTILLVDYGIGIGAKGTGLSLSADDGYQKQQHHGSFTFFPLLLTAFSRTLRSVLRLRLLLLRKKPDKRRRDQHYRPEQVKNLADSYPGDEKERRAQGTCNASQGRDSIQGTGRIPHRVESFHLQFDGKRADHAHEYAWYKEENDGSDQWTKTRT